MPARSLSFLYINTFLALIGGNMFNYGLIILSTDTANSDGFTGLVNFTNYVPTLFLSFYAGTILDRYSRLAVVYIFQSFFIATSLSLATMLAFGMISESTKWILPMVALVNGSALAFLVPGRFALIANIVPASSVPRATMVLNILVIVGFGIAPVFVGLIKQYHDWHVLFYGIAAVLIVAYVTLFPIRTSYTTEYVGGASAYRRFHDGLTFVRSSRLIQELLGFTFVGLFVVGPIFVVLPRYARDLMGMDEQGRGVLLATLGIGLFVGGMLAHAMGRRARHHGRWIMISCFAIGAILSVTGFVREPYPMAALLITAGVFGGIVSTLIPSLLQGAAPDEIRGRVLSFYTLAFQATPAISGFTIGLVSDRFGLENALWIAGAFIAAAALLGMLLSPELRGYTNERHRAAPAN
ncbi:MAG: MFS transporter [bacterium]|nr:MFS transporter [bacterium]